MTSTLLQKHPIKGSREFQLTDEEIQYTIQSPFKTDALSVSLDILEAAPIRSNSMLSFISKVNKEPLVELFLNKPNKEEFETFVKELQQQIIDNDFSLLRVGEDGVDVNLARLDESIEMLQKYVDPAQIESFLPILIELKENPTDITCQKKVADAFNELGFAQTQVITYAPYITFMFSGSRHFT